MGGSNTGDRGDREKNEALLVFEKSEALSSAA